MRTSELGPIPADFVILDRYQDVLPHISKEIMIAKLCFIRINLDLVQILR